MRSCGRYWLDKRANSPAWCICWMDGRQLRRQSTGTADLDAAIQALKARYLTGEPKGRPLSVEECAAWFDASAPHFHALLFICLATGSRPEAVKQLRWAQVDFDDGLLHLNPEERAQTSKRRPVVRMPPSLVAYLRQLPRASDHVVSFRGRPVDRYYTALGQSRRRAGLDGRVDLYSARHTVARWLRKQRVPFEEVAGQLGHRVPGFAITEIYAAYAPDYQALATAAIERRLQAIAEQAQSCRCLERLDPRGNSTTRIGSLMAGLRPFKPFKML